MTDRLASHIPPLAAIIYLVSGLDVSSNSMLILPDCPGVSWVQSKCPSLPYWSPNLLDPKEITLNVFHTHILVNIGKFKGKMLGYLAYISLTL